MVPVPSPFPMFPHPLPYREVSSWQQRQAAFSAGQLLEPAFPYLTRADWQRALNAGRPALYVVADQVLLTYDGLAQGTHYVATARPAAPLRPVAPARPPVSRRKGSRQATQLSPPGALAAALFGQPTTVSH